jgi:hypothetical protein
MDKNTNDKKVNIIIRTDGQGHQSSGHQSLVQQVEENIKDFVFCVLIPLPLSWLKGLFSR